MMDELIGGSVAMHCVRAAIDRFAGSRSPVVLIGETGTGKSRLARYLAAAGQRPDAPFICIDGAALDTGLMPADIQYAWVAAAGGTLFVDHIGETPRLLQAHLAALVTGKSEAGSAYGPGHAARLVTSSQVRLEQAMSRGRFDAALFTCMHGASIHLPALRFRPEDILELSKHFLAQVDSREHRYRLTAAAVERLQEHHWPGNVRELNNVLRRAMVLADARGLLTPADIVFDARGFATRSGATIGAPGRASLHLVDAGVRPEATA